MLAVQECPIGYDEFRPQLSKKLAMIGANLMVDVIKDLEKYENFGKCQASEGIYNGNL